MAQSLNKKLSELPAARRERILAETDRLHAEYLTLQELRKAMKLTQEQLAEMLKIRQATIAQTERRSDLMLSTLRSYVEAMGGKLSLAVLCLLCRARHKRHYVLNFFMSSNRQVAAV